MQMSLSQKVDKEIFRTIFIDHWDSFKERNPAYDQTFPGQYECQKKLFKAAKNSNTEAEPIAIKT